MKIAIIGTGRIGGTLGRGWRHVHDVVFGSRKPHDPAVRRLVSEAGDRARAVPVSEATEGADVVVLAVPWGAALEAVRDCGNLDGRIVVDCTNPAGPGLRHGLESGSVAEAIASEAAGARVVKAFNTAGFEVFQNPRFGSETASLFLCGDDADAKTMVAGLAQALGLDPVDCGPLGQARRLEELALLWISLASEGQGRDHAFRLLRR